MEAEPSQSQPMAKSEAEAEALERFSHSLSASLFSLLSPIISNPNLPLCPSRLQSLCLSFSSDISLASSLLINSLNHLHPLNSKNLSLPSAPTDHRPLSPCPPPSLPAPSPPPASHSAPSHPIPTTTPSHSPIEIKIPANRPSGSSNGKSRVKSLSSIQSRSHLLADFFDVPRDKTADLDEASLIIADPPAETRCSSPALSPYTDHSWCDRPLPNTAPALPAPMHPPSPGNRCPGPLAAPDEPDCLPDDLRAYIQSEIGEGFEQLLEDVALVVEEAKADLGSGSGSGSGLVGPGSASPGPAATVSTHLVEGHKRELEAFGGELEHQFEGQLLTRYEQCLAQFTEELNRLRGSAEAPPTADGGGGGRQLEEYCDNLEKRIGTYGARLKAELGEWKEAVLETLSDPGRGCVLAGRVEKLEGTVAKALVPNSLRTQTLAALGLVPSAQQRANLQVFLSQLEAHWTHARARVEAEEVVKALNESLAGAGGGQDAKDTQMQDGWMNNGDDSNKPALAASVSVLVDRLVHAVVRKIWPELGPLVENMNKYLGRYFSQRNSS